MPLVRTLTGFKPPARHDSVAFTTARVQEAAASNGTFATIESFTLTPVDSNPASPQARSFTTDQAALAAGWYRIRWEDAAGGTFDSDAVQFTGTSTASALFTIEQARRYPPLDNATEYPDALIEEAREYAQNALEDACNTVFLPRAITVLARVSDDQVTALVPRGPLRSISTIAGEAVTDATILSHRTFKAAAALTAQPGERVEITGQVGEDEPPARIVRAAILLARDYLVQSGISDRAAQLTTDGGVINLAIIGEFGIPEVDRAVAAYRRDDWLP